MADESTAFSIIIPTKNEGNALEECLKSVFAQSFTSFEVLIVDGGSTDNTLEIAKRFNAKIFREGKSPCPANARNLGAQGAKGGILLMMDADVLLHEDCLQNALIMFEDEKTVAVIPTDSGHDDSYLETIQRKWNEARTSVNVGFGKSKTAGLVVFLRKEVFEKVRFDPSYGFGEDDDFYTRLENEFKGYNILVAESCKVISHSPHTMGELLTRYRWWGRTSFPYLARHFSFKALLNIGSLLLPTIVAVTLTVSLLYSPAVFTFIFFFLIFIARILIACIRSRSFFFFQFAFFDFSRSFFFVSGLMQAPFTSKKGR